MGASSSDDRAGRPTAQAPAGLGDSATIPCAAEILGQLNAGQKSQIRIVGERGWADIDFGGTNPFTALFLNRRFPLFTGFSVKDDPRGKRYQLTDLGREVYALIAQGIEAEGRDVKQAPSR